MEVNNAGKSVLLFDGYCNLCSGSVVFILKRERKDTFRFASLQSAFAQNLLEEYRINGEAPDSIILIENNKVYYQSTAALRIVKQLKWPWPLLYGLIIIPRFIRDPVYGFIARNRYKWFGKREQCFMPGKDMSYKFLD